VRVHPSTKLDEDDDVTVDGDHEAAALRWLDAGHATSGTGEATHHIRVGPAGPIGATGRREREVVVDGWRFVLEIEPERLARLREKAARGRGHGSHGGPLEVRAIIPGRIVAVSVAVGDEIAAGHQLLVIEAMKMQNELRAPRAGVVERIAVGPGQTVELGTLLLVLR
jgi:biotin carboxyl carrier protein